MEKTKYCPNCMKEHDLSSEKCDCGFEFYIAPVVDEIASTNTVVIDDSFPQFIWTLIAILCPFAGFVLANLWVEKWPARRQNLMKNSIIMSIVWLCVGIIILSIFIGVKNGDVLI